MGKEQSPSSSPKTASLVGSIDQGRSIESCRAWMRVKTTRCSLDEAQRNPGISCSFEKPPDSTSLHPGYGYA